MQYAVFEFRGQDKCEEGQSYCSDCTVRIADEAISKFIM